MRLDYGLYGIAIICFIIAVTFAASAVPEYSPIRIEGITVIIIFIALGVISATVGYSARPRAVMPTTQPTPAPIPESSPPPTKEESSELLQPEPQSRTKSVVHRMEEETTVNSPTESEPAKVTEEKPKQKPVRRRRKKAQ